MRAITVTFFLQYLTLPCWKYTMLLKCNDVEHAYACKLLYEHVCVECKD